MIKNELYNMWKLLRSLMDDDDIGRLIATNPDYRDVRPDSSPEDMIQACLDLSNVMVEVCPPEMNNVIPLKR